MHQTSELLKLLNARREWEGHPSRPPVLDKEGLRALRKAQEDWGRANKSDPFAARRMGMYMLRGYDLVSDVQKDANQVLTDRARRQTKPEEV